jgi:hypothetical protein
MIQSNSIRNKSIRNVLINIVGILSTLLLSWTARANPTIEVVVGYPQKLGSG